MTVFFNQFHGSVLAGPVHHNACLLYTSGDNDEQVYPVIIAGGFVEFPPDGAGIICHERKQENRVGTVSYTHLDVYKRQVPRRCG